MQNPVSLDTAEKMIRIEQNISATFGKYLSYDETNFYKNMTMEQRKNFQKYLDNKKKKKWFMIAGLVSPLLLFSMLKVNFTGNVVRETVGENYMGFINWILIILFVIGLGLFLFNRRENRKFNAKFDSHSRIFDKILEKKV